MSRRVIWGDFNDYFAVKAYYDSEWQEYVVRLYKKFPGSKSGNGNLIPDADYFTSDKPDAIGSGKAMLKHATANMHLAKPTEFNRNPRKGKKNPRRATKKRAVKRNPGKVGRPRKTQADINRKKILTAYKPYAVQMQTKAGGKWFGVGRFDTKSEAVKHATILHNDLKSFAFRVVLL